MVKRINLVFLCLALLLSFKSSYASAAAITCDKVYTVQRSDWLSKIAEKYYGSIKSYPALIAATNRWHKVDASFAEINKPDQIEVGWQLCVPPAAEAKALLLLDPLASEAPPVVSSERYTLEDFMAEHNFSTEVDLAWIESTPATVKRFTVSTQQQEIMAAYGERANYLWNEHLGNDYFTTTHIFEAVPEEIRTYRAPWNTTRPRYRYPSNMTLPTGLTTNQYGWRGPQISLKKPNNTIRIAAIGASTTVGGHPYPVSYPEYLQHWLNLWSRENGYGVNFEVINTGREGFSSSDIVAVVRYEVLPMDVDYVIYYEGSNQFSPERAVDYPDDVVFGQPPAGTAPNFSNVDSDDKSVLDYLSDYSAIAARTRNVVEQYAYTGQEPPKPEQSINFPETFDELRPDPKVMGRILEMERIITDLEKIKQTMEDNKAKLLLSTFNWFVYDGMVLDPDRHRNLYGYLNRVYWPLSYANMRRLADIQNRVFKQWAIDNGVTIIDVSTPMPKQPDLYDDAIHNTPTGTRIRAWINFEALIPILKKEIENRNLPRPAKVNYNRHPYIKPEYRTRELASATSN